MTGGVPPASGEPAAVFAQLFDVRDLVVLVTAGASGLGLAIAGVLADCRAAVIIADRDERRLAEAGRELLAPGRVEAEITAPPARCRRAMRGVRRHSLRTG